MEARAPARPAGLAGGARPQHTLATAVRAEGPGLHTGRRCRLTLHPAPAGHGRRVVMAGAPAVSAAMTWANRVHSVMSTTIALEGGASLRTVEHLMAAFAALGVDNVLVEADGPEAPIFDGSARRWCRLMRKAGLVAQDAPLAVIEATRPVQIIQENGFLRLEPPLARDTDEPLRTDVTYDMLPDRPVKRWTGLLDRATFLSEIVDARSFGRFDWRRRFNRPPARDRAALPPNRPDPALPSRDAASLDALARSKAAADPAAPLLRGARPGRAAFVVGGLVLPFPRYRDEPLRHVVLDMIGDLALAGAPLRGRLVAHNPSHEKTYLLVAALMGDPSAVRMVTLGDTAAAACP